MTSGILKDRGYVAAISLDEDVLHGRVINTRDVISFEGKSVAELRRNFKESIDFYLEFCAKQGKEPNKPFSGEFRLRLPPELHEAVVAAATGEDKSLNDYVREQLERAVAECA